MLGEAVVVLNPDRIHDIGYLRMLSTQLASKMRFVSVQFEALLAGDLWLRNASHANAMAARLATAASGVAGVRITRPVQANAVFAILPPDVAQRLRHRSLQHVERTDRRGPLDVCLRHDGRGCGCLRHRARRPDERGGGTAVIRAPDPRPGSDLRLVLQRVSIATQHAICLGLVQDPVTVLGHAA